MKHHKVELSDRWHAHFRFRINTVSNYSHMSMSSYTNLYLDENKY